MVAGKWPHLLLGPWGFPSDVCRQPRICWQVHCAR